MSFSYFSACAYSVKSSNDTLSINYDTTTDNNDNNYNINNRCDNHNKNI